MSTLQLILAVAGYLSGTAFLAFWVKAAFDRLMGDYNSKSFMGPGMPHLFYGLVLLMVTTMFLTTHA